MSILPMDGSDPRQRLPRKMSQQANPYQQTPNPQRTTMGPGPGTGTPVNMAGGVPPPAPGPGARSVSPTQPQSFNRTQFRDDWMAKGRGANNQTLQQFLQPYGLNADPAGRVRLPTGETIDMMNNAKIGGEGAIWSGVPGATQKAGQAPTAGMGMPQQAIQQALGMGIALPSGGGLPSVTPAPVQLPQTPLPTYTPSQISQFQAPNMGQTQSLQTNLLNQILTSPESLSPEVAGMMKEQNKEGVLSMQDQIGQQMAGMNARRGMSQSGLAQSQQLDLLDRGMQDITRGNRGIDIAAAQTNMQDRLNALGMSDSLMSGQMGRAVQGYGAGLQGQLAQAQQNLQGQQSQADAVRFALEREIAGHQLGQGWSGLGLQNRGLDLQNRGLDLEGRRISEGARQFDLGLGYNYTNMNNQNNQWFWDMVLNGGWGQ